MADLSVAIDEATVKRSDLIRSLDATSESDKGRRIFVRADRAVPYGDLMDVLELLRVGGYGKIALVARERVSDPTVQSSPEPTTRIPGQESP